MLVCWSVKGGSGTSVVAASLGVLFARTRPTLLVDLDGDLPGVLGSVPEPTGPGVHEWLASPTADAAALHRLTVPVNPTLHLLPAGAAAAATRAVISAGGAPLATAGRVGHVGQVGPVGHVGPVGQVGQVGRAAPEAWQRLAAVLHGVDLDVVVDAGLGAPPAALLPGSTSLLVTRACYLSLRRAAHAGTVPDGVVFVREPGRSLGRRDIEHAVKAPVVAEVEWDPAIARSVDAGLLAGRLPASLGHGLRRAA